MRTEQTACERKKGRKHKRISQAKNGQWYCIDCRAERFAKIHAMRAARGDIGNGLRV